MKKFEVGKIYGAKSVKYEVVKRTQKMVTLEAIQHYGRFNERRYERKTLKIRNWEGREVVFYGSETVEAE